MMPAYRAAALALAMTGCRPAELVGGVQLGVEGGILVALVLGAKVDAARGKGQEWRRLSGRSTTRAHWSRIWPPKSPGPADRS
jgi:hypothetical protein